MKITRISTLMLGVVAAVTMNSCGEKFLDGEITSELDAGTAASLIETDPDALNAYLNGIWSFMVSFNVTGSSSSPHDDFSYMSVLHSTDMMSEDITCYNFHWFGYDYQFDNRMSTYRRTLVDWLTFYTMIEKSNEILDLFTEEPETPEAKGIMGQAYAVRGMSYYYLIQLYQQYLKDANTFDYDAKGVPMRYSKIDNLSDEEKKDRAGRNTVKMVFDQIESDLTKSVDLLNAGYQRPGGASGKDFIDASVANGLLARYYLMSQQWQKAADAAKAARTNYDIMDEKGLKDGFTDITNGEWMWGFDHNSETNTSLASFFSHMSNLVPGYAGLKYSGHGISDWLYNQMSDTDLRKANWFNDPQGSLYSNPELPGASQPYAILKFGGDANWEMDYVYMRASEMVLIEAEAYAHLGDGAKAATVLKELMEKRDPAWNKTSVTVNDVWIQRRIELIGEGFSFFDLKRLYEGIDRTKCSNHMTGFEFVVAAGAKDWTYQIPYREIQENDEIDEKDQNQ
jgi:hypothetical protein